MVAFLAKTEGAIVPENISDVLIEAYNGVNDKGSETMHIDMNRMYYGRTLHYIDSQTISI